MMINQFVNFNGTSANELFGVSESSGDALVERIYEKMDYIVKNSEEFSHFGIDKADNQLKSGVHIGKVTEALFSICENEQEKFLIIYCLGITMEELIRMVSMIEALNKIKDSVNDHLQQRKADC